MACGMPINLSISTLGFGDVRHKGVCRPRGTRVSNPAFPALKRWALLCRPARRDCFVGARLAAGYAWALLKNRPFAEGNERTALAAIVTYLEMNRHTWNCGEVEETAMLLRASAGKLKEGEWEAWVVGAWGSRGTILNMNPQFPRGEIFDHPGNRNYTANSGSPIGAFLSRRNTRYSLR